MLTQVSLVKAVFFSSSHVWMLELDCRESWVLNYWCFWTVVLEKTLESHLDYKEAQPVHPKGDQSWVFIGRIDVWPPDVKSWLKRPWWWERLRAGREGDDRGWDGWMASPIRWTWIWINSGSWWWTGRPGVLQSMGSQRVRHNWVTELHSSEVFCHEVMEPDAMILVILPCHDEQVFVTHWSYKPCCVRATKDGWIIVFPLLTKCSPLEEGMAKHFSIFASITPWTV